MIDRDRPRTPETLRTPTPALFVREFCHRPSQVAAIAATSHRLASLLAEKAAIHNARTIVELGAGNGAVTEHIVGKMPSAARLIAFEVNPSFAQLLAARFPECTVVEDSAENLQLNLDRLGVASVASVVSTLPWFWLSEDSRKQIMDQVWSILRKDGVFVTCMHVQSFFTPRSADFQRDLKMRFRDFSVSRIIWRNVMPAFAVSMRK